MATFRFTRAQEAAPRQGAWSGVGKGLQGMNDSVGGYLKDIEASQAAEAKAAGDLEQRNYDRDRDIIGDEFKADGLAQQKRVSDAQAKNFEMKNKVAQDKITAKQQEKDQAQDAKLEKDLSLRTLMDIVAEKGIKPRQINDKKQRQGFLDALSESGAVSYMDEVEKVFNLTKSYQEYLTPEQILAQSKAGRGSGGGKKGMSATGAKVVFEQLAGLGAEFSKYNKMAQAGLLKGISPKETQADLSSRAAELRGLSEKLSAYFRENPKEWAKMTATQKQQIYRWGRPGK